MREAAALQGARNESAADALVVWRLTDAKPGHESQSLGLVEALAERVETETHTLPAPGVVASLGCLCTGRFPLAVSYPDPDLIIGAGHGTHLGLLAARRARGGRAIVLMTPSLPRGLFDLCLIPEHDQPPASADIIVTRGALNRVRPRPRARQGPGLILLGGPSKHFAWRDDDVIRQIARLLQGEAATSWTLTTSRRTPPALVVRLLGMRDEKLEVILYEETSPDWIAEQLGRAACVWVSEDSASMVYEALSSGAAVGLITLPRSRPSRLSRGLDDLVGNGWLTRFDDWQTGRALSPPPAPLNEAARCADAILSRWPELASR
jgi:mitochondrial fission protein ELM1